MRVRILKVPPASKLEGLDLSTYDLQLDQTRELKTPVAETLIEWGYACRVVTLARPIKKKRIGRGK